MKTASFVLASMTMLTGCVGPMIENLSMKGEPIARLQQRYGTPAEQVRDSEGGRYAWVRQAGTGDECRMNVTTDPSGRVTDVKMIGRMRDCRGLRHPDQSAG